MYRRVRAKIDKKVFAEQVFVACRLVDKCQETYEAALADILVPIMRGAGLPEDA